MAAGGENIGLRHQDAPKAQGEYNYYPTKPPWLTWEQIVHREP